MFLKAGLGGTVAQFLPGISGAQGNGGIRLEWQQFKTTSQYPAFRSAIAAMRSNTNAASLGSLRFWTNVHVNQCPHGVPYFISWHRGYLHYFEQQLRIASGNPTLNLPYWNYYANPTLPAEFTDPTPGNPLYMPRSSANVHSALSLAPFASTVRNFQRGKTNAFEPKIEDVHNPVHDLIGGIMRTMESPLDPIFYLHHASVDRLTHAWSLLGGKAMPKSANPYSAVNSDPYWAGNNVYAANLSIERYKTLYPSWLGTSYASNAAPTALPPQPSALQHEVGRTSPSDAQSTAPELLIPSVRRPPFRAFTPVAGRRLSATRRSVGGVAQLALDERSVSVLVRLTKADAADVARVAGMRRDDAIDALQRRGSIKVVIERPAIIGAARKGGFFYALYLDMPAQIESSTARELSFIGTLGAFQIAAASHHGAARIEFDVSHLLAQQKRVTFPEMSLSWVRVDGDRPPAGAAIRADEVRLDLSFDLEGALVTQAPDLADRPRHHH